jgi:hypothetical protein
MLRFGMMQEKTKNLKPSLEKKKPRMEEYNIHISCHLFLQLAKQKKNRCINFLTNFHC